jgi:membrane protein DedA with SNARE-associated domain
MDVLRPFVDAFVGHTYVVVFSVALIDATGVPFPGRLLLAGAGAYAASGGAHAGAIIALSALGAMVSDQAWFWAATRGGAWLLDVYCRLTRRPPGCADETVAGLERYGPLSVILGRFFTVVRVVVWPTLVRNGLGRARFTALDAVGALVWSGLWVGLGFMVGDRWQDAAQSVSGWLTLAALVLAGGLAAPLALRAWRRHARRRGAH